MAIVKMKRLRLVGMRSDREKLLRLLQHLGCVQVGEPALDQAAPEWEGLTRPDGQGLSRAREQSIVIGNALETLKKYAPAKEGMFRKRPELTEAELFDEAAYAAGLETAAKINAAERRINTLLADRGKMESQRASLAPWASLDVPLELSGDGVVSVLFGAVPAKADYAEMEGAVASAAADLAALTDAGADRELHYFLLVCHASVESACTEAMRPYGFSHANLKGWTGTAEDNIRALTGAIAAADGQMEEIKAEISACGSWREALLRCADRAAQEIAREEAKGRLLDTADAFFLEGWVPAEDESRLAAALSGCVCAWETETPEAEEYPDVPVKLKNNWFSRPLNMVTDMYALPAYGSLDPNPLMAPFFILFYGIMMADMGYGLLMMIASAVIMKKARPNGPTMRHMIPLLGLCGMSTFLMGALTGGFFGDLLPQLAMLIDPETSFTSMPSLFSPLDDALMVLIGSLALGLVQIFTGMGISMYKQIRRGEVMAALCGEGAWFLAFLCAGLGFALGAAKYGLLAALAVIVLTQGYGKKGVLGKLMGIGGSLYNNITGYFSDILSYSRLMALMLAGAVIAQVFNTLGAITGNVITFFVIAMIGNALNFALNLLGCFVHDMRLQCLEFFGRFYEDGGKPFRPLEVSTKYVDISNTKQ